MDLHVWRYELFVCLFVQCNFHWEKGLGQWETLGICSYLLIYLFIFFTCLFICLFIYLFIYSYISCKSWKRIFKETSYKAIHLNFDNIDIFFVCSFLTQPIEGAVFLSVLFFFMVNCKCLIYWSLFKRFRYEYTFLQNIKVDLWNIHFPPLSRVILCIK